MTGVFRLEAFTSLDRIEFDWSNNANKAKTIFYEPFKIINLITKLNKLITNLPSFNESLKQKKLHRKKN